MLIQKSAGVINNYTLNQLSNKKTYRLKLPTVNSFNNNKYTRLPGILDISSGTDSSDSDETDSDDFMVDNW